VRPHSIVMFERLFLASLALSLLGSLLAFDAVVDEMTRDPAVQQMGLGGGFVGAVLAIGLVVYLLLWFLIARKASNIAKWILVVFVAIGVISLLVSMTQGFTADLPTLLGLVNYALELAAVSFLFRSDAVAWLTGEAAPADPTTFE
jgi:hypothetical protein